MIGSWHSRPTSINRSNYLLPTRMATGKIQKNMSRERYWQIDYDKSDVLVALQVVRQDEDGSLVLLWMMLKKFAAPKPERPKQP